ncbi:MFS family permease [Actinoplanes tereljensis]|nr:MFS transporter [Actinoplanes tereljensis]
MFEALRVRDFRLLWLARIVSDLGTWLLMIAVPAHVFTLTGSVTATGLTLAVQFAPAALLGPFAGVLVDRWNRRWTLIGADLGRAAVVTVLLLVREPGDLWLLYAVLVAESIGTVVFRPAAQAHTPALVGTASTLSSANALNALADGTVRVVGGPLGGVLLIWIGFDLLIGLDAASYLLSALGILLTAARREDQRAGITQVQRGEGGPGASRADRSPADSRAEPGGGTEPSGPEHASSSQPIGRTESGGQDQTGRARPEGRRRFQADLREGLAFLGAQAIARNLLLINTFFLAINACLSALLISYGMTVLGGSAPTGLVMAALGIGFLLGAPFLRILVDRSPPAYLLGGSLAITGIGYAALFTSTGLVTALPAATIIGAAGSITLGAVQTSLQRVTPAGILGRTSSAVFTAEAVATIAGALAGPALTQAVSLTAIAVAAGIAAILIGLLATTLLPHTPLPTAELTGTAPAPAPQRQS